MYSPVGVFDSGLGGLSVVRQMFSSLPNEQVLYLADNIHVPYGERPLQQVCNFACAITDFLVRQGAKAVVMACNISSAVALNAARERHPNIPVFGMIEPGSRAACGVSRGLPIGVLATTGTVNSGAYLTALKNLHPQCKVVQQACPEFVPLVEGGKAGTDEAYETARRYVSQLSACGCATLVLGCTHYPFLADEISAAAGAEVPLVDPAREAVKDLRAALDEIGLLSPARRAENLYYVSGETDSFDRLGALFLGVESVRARQASWVGSKLTVVDRVLNTTK